MKFRYSRNVLKYNAEKNSSSVIYVNTHILLYDYKRTEDYTNKRGNV